MKKKISVLYSNKDILVINKPAGISVHGDGRSDVETLADLILAEYPEMKDVGEPMEIDIGGGEKKIIYRPGIVHRLDKDTSGVLILARNQKAYEYLKEQFQNREVKKTYNTLVYGNMKNDFGIVDAGIGRSPSDPRKRIASRGKTGKIRDAVTEYKVLKRISVGKRSDLKNSKRSDLEGTGIQAPHPSPLLSEGEGEEKFTWLEVKPKTGRTHQIRVHMKFLNHPVVADQLYTPKDATTPFGISRLALHASSIEFKNLKGETIKIEAPLPEDLEKILEK
ncbi:MAG: RluA family pseudouridine synthase [Candidatus Nomurabacteria bacterium]|nr:RluA family pseudouridine synthase [Candidatus Nomurabacteria bacterium]